MSAFRTPETSWCPECQRERINCSHQNGDLVADGGTDYEWPIEDHLEAALEQAQDDEVREHIRRALQRRTLILSPEVDLG